MINIKNKNYIMDGNRVRMCYANIAKMNVIEYGILKLKDGFLKRNFLLTIEQYKDGIIYLISAIINTIFLILFPVALFIRGVTAIKTAKKAVSKK